MALKIFYHVAAINHWETVVRSHCTKLLFSGLYDACESIGCFVHGSDAARASDLLVRFGAKYEILHVDAGDSGQERNTLQKMHAHIQPGDKILYIHTKGVSRCPPSPHIEDWTMFMDVFLIARWKTCVDLLDSYDVLGTSFYPESKPHFSGNQWWARGDHYRRLGTYDGPADADRYTHSETYVCGGHDGLAPRLYQLARTNFDHYATPCPPSLYVDRPKKTLASAHYEKYENEKTPSPSGDATSV